MYDDPVAAKLLDQIAAGEPAHLALADWLSAQPGELERAHGELIVRQCGVGARDAKREAELQAKLLEALVPVPFVSADRLAWERGFLAEVTLVDHQPRRPNRTFFLPELMTTVLDSRLGRAVRAIGMFSVDPSLVSMIGSSLAKHLHARRGLVSRLAFGEQLPDSDDLLRGTAIFGTGDIWTVGLGEIYLRGTTFHLPHIVAPGLRALTLEGGLDDETLHRLRTAEWPELRAISLGLGAYRVGTYVNVAEIDGPALAGALAASPWIGQIRTLDLAYCNLADDDVEHLAPHLVSVEAIDVRGNRLSQDCREELLEQWPTMEWADDD